MIAAVSAICSCIVRYISISKSKTHYLSSFTGHSPTKASWACNGNNWQRDNNVWWRRLKVSTTPVFLTVYPVTASPFQTSHLWWSADLKKHCTSNYFNIETDIYIYTYNIYNIYIYLPIIEWGWVGCEVFCRSRRVLSTQAEGRGG